MHKDITLLCAECKQEFVFTAGEQDFYRQKGLSHPLYCMICRGRKTAEERYFKSSKRKHDLS